MIELIVLVFDDEEGALQMRDKLLAARKQRLLQLADAAVAIRHEDGKVKITKFLYIDMNATNQNGEKITDIQMSFMLPKTMQ